MQWCLNSLIFLIPGNRETPRNWERFSGKSWELHKKSRVSTPLKNSCNCWSILSMSNFSQINCFLLKLLRLSSKKILANKNDNWYSIQNAVNGKSSFQMMQWQGFCRFCCLFLIFNNTNFIHFIFEIFLDQTKIHHSWNNIRLLEDIWLTILDLKLLWSKSQNNCLGNI